MVITTFIDLTRTTVVYRLAYMKKSGNRLSRRLDFVIHYKFLYVNSNGSHGKPQIPVDYQKLLSIEDITKYRRYKKHRQ